MQSIALNTSLSHQQGLQTTSWTELLQNFKKICRLCGAHNDYLISIFGAEGETHSLGHKIHLYLQLQVRREDVLPSQLCYECMSSLLSWHFLYQNCQETHRRFQTMLEKAEFPIRQESVLISPPKTLEQFQISSHDYSDPSLPTDTQNNIHHGIDVARQQHCPMPNTPRINVNQLVEDQDNRLLSYEIKSDRHLQLHNIPEIETVGQNELDRVFVSETPSSMPLNSRVITNISHIVSNISNEIQYQEHAELSHTITDNQNVIDNESGDEYGYISSHKKDSTISTLKKASNQNSFLKKKSSSPSLESSAMLNQSNAALRDDVMATQFTNRVSAIQLTTSSDFYQQESTCRSKSVLVRHESVHPSVLVSDNQNASHIAETEASTFIESAVIREHRNIDCLNNEGKGTMVSVVRPTCLRRAPTAVVVIESVSTKCSSDSSESKEITPEDEEDKIFNKQTPSNNCIHDSSESKDAYTSSCDATSIRSTEGEAKGLDLSHICFLCKKFISNPVLLLSHEKSHLTDSNPPISFICKFCSHPQNSLHDMHLHYTIHEIEMGKLQKNYSNRRVYLCKQCGLVCATEERLAGHQRLHADSVESFRHECKTCGETFSTRSKLSVHLWTHALKPSLKTFKCHICGKGFGTKSSVMEHRQKHTEEEKSRAFKCVICSMAFGNNTLLGKHRLTHTQEELARPFKCTFCGKAFARNHTLQIHYLSHSNQKNHICNQCGKGFKMRNSLIQHMRTHQDPSALPSYPCSLCGKNFKVKSRLRDHLRLHSGEKPFVCATCGKCFHKVTALHTHEISHTERRAFICDVCGKAFKWSKNLRQHKSVHIGPNTSTAQPQPSTSSFNSSGCKLKSKPKQKLCQCSLCGKEFSSKASLRHHVRSIHDERENKSTRPTICSICGKELSNTAGLMRHMKITHGGEKAFKCDICSREYSTKVARDDHRRSHTGERPYTCSICPKTFSSLSNLHIHKASHSEDRPHKCSYCNKQFKRRAHLVPHIRTHTGEKPYVCNICSRGFAQSNDLHKHRLTHSNDKAFTCYCGQAYRIKRDLIRHQNKHHPHNLPPEAQPQVGSESLNSEVDISHQKQQIILTPGLPPSASSFNPNQTSDTSVISSSIIICSSMMQNKR